jgi:hypothetical protein
MGRGRRVGENGEKVATISPYREGLLAADATIVGGVIGAKEKKTVYEHISEEVWIITK